MTLEDVIAKVEAHPHHAGWSVRSFVENGVKRCRADIFRWREKNSYRQHYLAGEYPAGLMQHDTTGMSPADVLRRALETADKPLASRHENA